jgi:hypothetical protein
MEASAAQNRSRQYSANDKYFALIALALAGYALFGRGFAYVGVRPLYVGEIVLFLGIGAALRTRCLLAPLATVPSLFLIIAMTWVVFRTLPYIGTYGFDALRDSVIVMYGIFAFAVAALLIEDPRRINQALTLYDKFASLFVILVPFAFFFSRFMWDYLPRLPGTNSPIVDIRPTEVGVHLAGVALFAIVGFRRMRPGTIIILLFTLTMIAALSRGGALAFFVPVLIAALTMGRFRAIAIMGAACISILSIAYLAESVTGSDSSASGQRSFSAHQIVENATSILSESDQETEATKQWRLRWWSIIFEDTLHGPHFWTGRGFGINLADADGFADGLHPDSPSLRSPHNAHMTHLARGGVPGLALWLLVLLSWFAMIVKTVVEARFNGNQKWAALFTFIGCYELAMVIDASFDVALEGPMIGIWFWCLFGFGIGSVMIYRAPVVFRLRRLL